MQKVTVSEIRDILEAEIVVGDELEKVLDSACACDLLSDVLRCTTKGSILLTNLTHQQTVRVADMVDAFAICFMRGRKPQKDTIELARKKGIVLLSTNLTTYEASGRLYQKSFPGCHNTKKES